MSEISFIGLGALGSKIAITLIENDCQLTVWNRSSAKAEPLINRGAQWADTLEAAVSDSPIIMICIDNFETTQKIFSEETITPLLAGKTIVQLSTGTPAETRAANTWFSRHGAELLVSMIMVYPVSIGKDEAQLLISGPEHLYQKCIKYFHFLGGDIRYLGSNIGAASAMSLAILGRIILNLLGLVHGANICVSEGVKLSEYAKMFPPGDRAQTVSDAIESNDYRVNGGAAIDIALVSAASLQDQARDVGINSEIPDFAINLFQRVIDAGYRGQDSASLFKVLRSENQA
ncbi:MAG: NAD(P)-dependent oxidoreductase [Gammaproteobacteria bacterium]|nr:NAD(P)-dependent oxidoreductase [Gammaproteobacteria bacterium]